MTTIITAAGKGAALTPTEADTNFKLGVTAVTTTPFTVTGAHNRNTLELKSGSDVVNLTAYATLIAEDTGDFEVTIKNRSGSDATISAAGVETFDGIDADITLPDGASITLKAGSVADDFMVKSDLSRALTTFTGVSQGSFTPATTYYAKFIGDSPNIGSPIGYIYKSTCPLSGVMHNFFVRAGLNGTDGTIIFTVMVDEVATALTITLAGADTTVNWDNTHSVYVSAGSQISLRMAVGTRTTGNFSGLEWGATLS